MATEVTPNSQATAEAGAAAPPPVPVPPMSSTLALLTASAVGSFLGSRLGAKPLAVALGAAALAWLNQKKVPARSPAAMPLRADAAPSPCPAAEPTTPPIWPEAPQAPAFVPPSSPARGWAAAPVIPAPEAVTEVSPVWVPPPVAAPVVPPSVFEPVPIAPAAAPAPAPAPAPTTPSPSSLLPVPPDPAADPRIQAWLARQMDREERAAAQESLVFEGADTPSSFASDLEPAPEPARKTPFDAEVHVPEAPLEEEDDDYRPEPLLADSSADLAPWQPDAFAALTEPSLAQAPPRTAAETATPLETEPEGEWLPPAMEAANPEPPWAVPPAGPPPQTPPAEVEAPAQRPVFVSSFQPVSQPPPTQSPFTPPVISPSVAASAIPGIEPLPSWSEIGERRPPPPEVPLASFQSAAFSAKPPAPVAKAEVDLESLFDMPAFEGSPLTDEATVAEAKEGNDEPEVSAWAATSVTEDPWQAPANTPIFAEAAPVLAQPSPWAAVSVTSAFQTAPVQSPEDRMEAFFNPLKAVPAAMPEQHRTDTAAEAAAPVPEISVHVAPAGEAWFDSPMAAAGVPNPWLPPKGDVNGSDVPLTSSFAPLTPSAPSVTPVVDAEVVLRPRAPTQASVVVKSPPAAKPAIVDPVEVSTTPEDPPLAGGASPSPREQRSRAAWRSWWKGD